MSALQRGLFTALAALVTATGVLYFWMKDLLSTDDPFAVVNHPLQPAVLDLHLLAAPALLVVFGTVFNAHIARKMTRRGPMRPSGLTCLAAFAVMGVSGYLLPVVVDAAVRRVMVWTHLGSGVLFATTYSVHLLGGLRRPRRAAIQAGAAVR